MATRIYLESSGTPAISPTPNGGWTDTSQFTRFNAGTTKASSTMTTKNISDALSNQQDVLIGQWITPYLVAGQTITAGSVPASVNFSVSARFSETANNNNLFPTVGVYIFNGTTLQATIVTKTIGTFAEATTTLSSKWNRLNNNSYTTVAGDQMVIEIGLSGDPAGGNTHNGAMSYGSDSASDLPSSDGTTTADNPWVNFGVDTLTFTNDLSVSENEAVTVTESVTILIPILFISVNDAPTTTESVAMNPVSYVNVNDTISLIESVSLSVVNNINVSDTPSLTESITVQLVSRVSVFDVVTVSDDDPDSLLHSYSEIFQNTTQIVEGHDPGGVNAMGQSFLGQGAKLTRAKFYFGKTGSPTGNAVARLYAHTGTFGSGGTPTGAALATSTNSIDVSALSSLALQQFTFDGTFTLVNGTAYFIVVEFNGGSAGNGISVGYDTTWLRDAGNGARFNVTSGTWSALAGEAEVVFYVYDDSEGSIIITVNAPESDTYFVSVSDSITVTESVTVLVPTLVPSIIDTITVSESIVLEMVSYVFVFDSVSVIESVTNSVVLNANIFDSISITESVQMHPISLPNVFDSISVTESVVILIPTLVPSVSDTTTVSESVTIQVNVTPFVFDAVSITESVAISIPIEINVFDSILVTETLITNSLSAGSGSNDASLGAGLDWNDPNEIINSDDQRATRSLPNGGAVSKLLKGTGFGFSIPSSAIIRGIVVEIEKSQQSAGVGAMGNIYDNAVRIVKNGVVGTEDKSNGSAWSTSDTYVSYGGQNDLWGLAWRADDINSSNFGAGISARCSDNLDDNIARVDHIRITVYYTLVALEIISYPFVFDSSSITESVTVKIITDASLSDTTTISEFVDLRVSVSVNVFDAISVAEFVQLSVASENSIDLTVFDVVTVTEFLGYEPEIVSVGEHVNILIPTLVPSISDSTSVSEFVQLQIILPVSVFDSVVVTEQVTVRITVSISVNDQVTVAETISVVVPTVFISVSEAVTTVEFTSINTQFPTPIEGVTISEFVQILIPTLVPSVQETITVTEFIVLSKNNLLEVFDTVTVDEFVRLTVALVQIYRRKPRPYSNRDDIYNSKPRPYTPKADVYSPKPTVYQPKN